MTSAAAEPAEPLVVVINPDEAVTAESFEAWLERRQAGAPSDPGVTAAETLAEVRTAGEA
jgi:hypothetical protein